MYIGLYKTPNKALSCLVLSCNAPPGGGGGTPIYEIDRHVLHP